MSETRFSEPIIMRDGVKLSTIIIKPKDDITLPVFLIRTPYSAKKKYNIGKTLAEKLNSIFVLQDTRGRYDSEGDFNVLDEKNDTLDTINWIKKQSWFNGGLHIFGASYLGYVGLQVLDDDSANIHTMFAPMIFNPSDSIYRGGVLQLHWALPWSIMTSTKVQASLTYINDVWPAAYDITYQKDLKNAVKNLGWPDQIWKFFTIPTTDSTWDKFRIKSNKELSTKVCLVGGWFDFLLNGTFTTYDELMNRGGVKPDLIIGPWSHNGYLASQAGVRDWDFGKDGAGNFIQDLMSFIDRYKNNGNQMIKVFIQQANKWMDLDSWPPGNVIEQRYYLQENQVLSDTRLTDELVELSFKAEMNNPVPTLGGLVWESYEPVEPGPVDQSPLKQRDDILKFYTKEFDQNTTFLGLALVELWVKTIVPETHFTAKLVVVDSEGKERIFQDGILKVLGPLSNYKLITIDLIATGIEIKKGEQIGLEVSWSNFPKFALPPLTTNSLQKLALAKNMSSVLKLSKLNKF